MTSDKETERPQPGPGDESGADGGSESDSGDGGPSEHDMVDRDKIDFDPDDGLYSGTAVDGSSEIPGPHERQEDVEGTGPPENEDDYDKRNSDETGDDGKSDDDS